MVNWHLRVRPLGFLPAAKKTTRPAQAPTQCFALVRCSGVRESSAECVSGRQVSQHRDGGNLRLGLLLVYPHLCSSYSLAPYESPPTSVQSSSLEYRSWNPSSRLRPIPQTSFHVWSSFANLISGMVLDTGTLSFRRSSSGTTHWCSPAPLPFAPNRLAPALFLRSLAAFSRPFMKRCSYSDMIP